MLVLIWVFHIACIVLDVDGAPDRVPAVAGIIDIDDAISDSLPKGIIFYLHTLPIGNSTGEIPGAPMKNERLLQSSAEFLQGKAYLFFIIYDDHLWDIYISVGDGNNGAIIIFFDPSPAPFAVGNRRIDAVDYVDKKHLSRKWPPSLRGWIRLAAAIIEYATGISCLWSIIVILGPLSANDSFGAFRAKTLSSYAICDFPRVIVEHYNLPDATPAIRV